MRWYLAGLVTACISFCGASLTTAGPEISVRPLPRGQTETVPDTRTAAILSRSLRPQPRGTDPAAQTREPVRRAIQNPASFTSWARSFRNSALRQGISARVFDTAFADVEYLPQVVEHDRNQSEFTKQIWEYLETAVSANRIRNGQQAFDRYRRTLRSIERQYGVDAYVVAAIWGLETAYGAVRGSTNVISAMASLAYDARRKEFFEDQLLAALQILQSGEASMTNMRGSWAGAMGHTQFMPDSYLTFSVDATGDGRRDIWGDDPVDALASAANFLREKGWTPGQPWGIEVRLPRNFDFRHSGERIKKRASDWNAMGVRTISGGTVPDHGPSSVLVPAGAGAAAFVIYDNFYVLEEYNPADAYVIGVGHLADRIRGGGSIQGSWPRSDRALSLSERREMQTRLRAVGCDPGKFDGIVGPNTIQAIRCFQGQIGQVPDGYANTRLLARLRNA